ncbi:hypothetical protein OU584_23820, partial [Escherichia coli]|nr:hypothetical protein [Escherichia coli]MDF8673608.1 hypothetical protein [Escherichia coli]
CDRRWMPNHDRFECQTAIDSDAILQYTQHELDLVAAQLNNRPRKTLKFKTPKEIIERGVALTD